MTRLRAESGFALMELMIVMSLSLVLMFATMLTFERMVTNENENDKRQDAIELARRTLDIEARQLRNLAKRINNVGVIAKTDPYDFIFQTSDPSRTWVRYCLNAETGVDNARVYEQTQALPLTASGSSITPAMHATCPSSDGWTRAQVVANHVTNVIGGRNRPLFSYRCFDNTTNCIAAPANYDQIVGVEAQLMINTTPKIQREELSVNSSVFLRNQNQAPVASFTTSVISSTPRTLLFNASGSTDYEGRTLQHFWFLNTMPTEGSIRCDEAAEREVDMTKPLWGGRVIGRGVAFQYSWRDATPASGSAQTVGLVSCDPGDRYDYEGPRTVTIP